MVLSLCVSFIYFNPGFEEALIPHFVPVTVLSTCWMLSRKSSWQPCTVGDVFLSFQIKNQSHEEGKGFAWVTWAPCSRIGVWVQAEWFWSSWADIQHRRCCQLVKNDLSKRLSRVSPSCKRREFVLNVESCVFSSAISESTHQSIWNQIPSSCK